MAAKMTKRKTGAKNKTAAKTVAKKPPAKKAPAKKAAAKRVAAKRAAPKRATRPRAAAKPATPAKKEWSYPPVVHWEISAVDPARQRDFFSALLDWSIDANNPQNYGMVASAGEGAIGGGIGGGMDARPYVTFYVEVGDINATLAKAESLGATTVMPRTDIGMVVLGQFRDLEGNIIGLIESRPS